MGMSARGASPTPRGEEEGTRSMHHDVWQAVHSPLYQEFAPCCLLPEELQQGDGELQRRTVPRGVTIAEAQAAAGGGGGGEEGKEGGAGGKRSVLYGNLKVYTLFRLYVTMYERLSKAKAIAAATDARKQSDARDRHRAADGPSAC